MAKVEVVFGVKNAALKSGIAEAKGTLAKFRNDAAGMFAGAFALGGIGAWTRSVIDYADRIQDLSDIYEVSTDDLQRWGHAAEMNASSAEAVADALRKLTVGQSEAVSGNQTMVKDFATLGVTLEDLRTMGPDGLLRKIGAGSLNAAALVKVLGRNALELRPTLRGVADGSIEVGEAMSRATIKGLAAFADSLKTISLNAKVLTGELMGKGISTLQRYAAAAGGLAADLEDAGGRLLSGDFKGAIDLLNDPNSAGRRGAAAEMAKQREQEEQRSVELATAKAELEADAAEKAEKRQQVEQDRLSVMTEQEARGERAAKRLETMLEYDRKLRDIEREIAAAREANNTELVDSLSHLKNITAEQRRIATDPASQAFDANGGQAPTATNLRRQARARKAQQRKEQRFRDNLVDGVMPTEFGIGGEATAGIDPITGEKVRLEKGGKRGVDRRQGPAGGADVRKPGAAEKSLLVEKLSEVKTVLENIEKKVGPPLA